MIELRVNNMTCGHCVSAVTQVVKRIDPLATVEIDLDTKRVRVETPQPREAFRQALADAGYPPA